MVKVLVTPLPGTFAVVSLMTGSVVEQLVPTPLEMNTSLPAAAEFEAQRIGVASAVALLSGIIMVKSICLKGFKFDELFYFNSLSLCPQLCMFGLQLGFLSTYLSEPIVKAFTSAAAFHVTVSQLQSMLGLRLPRHTGTFSLFRVSMLTRGWSHLTIAKGSLWYCPDFRVRCGEPASHQHGGAVDLFGVFGRPGASQGNQYSFPEAPAHTHPRGDPHSQSADFILVYI